MTWTFLLFFSIYLGYNVASLFSFSHFDSLQRVFIGVMIGFVVNSWLYFIFSLFFKPGRTISYLCIFFMLLISFLLSLARKRKHRKFVFYLSRNQIVTYIVSLIFAYFVMHYSMLYDNVYTKGAAYSDLPFHLNIISSFSHGCNVKRKGFYDILSVFFAGEKLAYPFIPNVHSALLVSSGFTIYRYALLVPSFLVFSSLIMAIYSMTFEVSKSHSASSISIFLFMTLGGMGWTNIVNSNIRNDVKIDWIHKLGNDNHAFWFHSLLHIIIPQRNSLWALPIIFWSMLSLIIATKHKDKKMMAFAGILTSLLPQIQAHGYMAMAQYSILLMLVTFPYKQREQWKFSILFWLRYAGFAIVLALPQLPLFFNRLSNKKSTFFRFCKLWSNSMFNNIGPIRLWWQSLGCFFIISIFLIWLVIDKWQKTIYIPSFCIFISSNFIVYQPWIMDNTKIFYSGWIPLAIPMVSYFLSLLNERKITKVLLYALLFSMSFSSIISSCKSFMHPTPIFNKNDYQFGLWTAENSPTNSIIASYERTSNPAASIAGRQLFFGFGGWVFSHGLDYSKGSVNKNMLSNYNNLSIFKENNIDYLLTKNLLEDSKCWKTVFRNNENNLMKFDCK